MPIEAIERLYQLTETVPAKLDAINVLALEHKPAPGKWSKKQLIGHLIDSATNNHHRFIRAQYEDAPCIGYDQNQWNELNHWQDTDKAQLIGLWTLYNRHLITVLKHISVQDLQQICRTDDNKTHTLEWLVTDYVAHMEHHLKQILDQ